MSTNQRDQKRTDAETYILDLPIEIFNYIFEYLPVIEIYMFVAPTCRLFQELVYCGKLPCMTKLTLSPTHTFLKYPHGPVGFKGEVTDEIVMTFGRVSGEFVKEVCIKQTTNPNKMERYCRRNLTDKSLIYFFNESINLEKVELVCVTIRDYRTVQCFGDLQKLNTLIFNGCSIELGDIKEPPVTFSQLRTLKIFDCSGKIGKYITADNLENLYIQENDDFPISSSNGLHPNLETLIVKKVKQIYGMSTDRFTVNTFPASNVESCPNLRILSLQSCFLSDRFKKPMENIEELEISVSSKHKELYLFNDKKMFPKLRKLKIASHYFVGAGRFDLGLLKNIPMFCPDLEELEIRNSNEITYNHIETLLSGLKQLRSARFPNCRRILSLPLAQTILMVCPSLDELEVAWPGSQEGQAASFQGEDIVRSLLSASCLDKLERLILRGFPPLLYPELKTYQKITLVGSDLPVTNTLKSEKEDLFYHQQEDEGEDDDDDENPEKYIKCGCGKKIDRIMFSKLHRFVCPYGRLMKFEDYESVFLTCKTCGLQNIPKRRYERHLLLHQEQVCLEGGWSCKCQNCTEYVLKKRKDGKTESLDEHHQNCDQMIVLCNACGEDIKLGDYDNHIENECKNV